jgi:H+/Cl- antiporter ClcA
MKIPSILKNKNRWLFYILLGILFILDNVSTYLALSNVACVEGNPLAVPFVLNLPLNFVIKIGALIAVVIVFELFLWLGRTCAKKYNWSEQDSDKFYLIILFPLVLFMFLFLITVISNFSCYLTGKIFVRLFF